MENTLESFEYFVNEDAGKENLRKVFSGLYANYSHTIISNALQDNDLMQIPDTAANELFYLSQLIKILEGDYFIPGRDLTKSEA